MIVFFALISDIRETEFPARQTILCRSCGDLFFGLLLLSWMLPTLGVIMDTITLAGDITKDQEVVNTTLETMDNVFIADEFPRNKIHFSVYHVGRGALDDENF